MELEEMKKIWTEMSQQIDQQKKLTDKLIIDMTQKKFTSTVSRIRTPETIATFFCFGFALLVLMNFNKYESGFLMFCAIFCIAYFILMPILSLITIRNVNNVDITNSNYRQIMVDYAKGKQKLLSVQKLSFYLGFVLMITSLPVMLVIIGGKVTRVEPNVWLWYLPVGTLFFFVFARWVYRHYVRVTIQAENLLKELNEFPD